MVVFSDHSEDLLTSADLIHLYTTNGAYWGYLAFAMCIWTITHFIYTRYYHARMVDGRLLWRHNFIEPFTFAVSSAIIGTQGIVCHVSSTFLHKLDITLSNTPFRTHPLEHPPLFSSGFTK